MGDNCTVQLGEIIATTTVGAFNASKGLVHDANGALVLAIKSISGGGRLVLDGVDHGPMAQVSSYLPEPGTRMVYWQGGGDPEPVLVERPKNAMYQRMLDYSIEPPGPFVDITNYSIVTLTGDTDELIDVTGYNLYMDYDFLGRSWLFN